ncbi:hypothetical protein [Pedobacter jeongneungensis]|uniref:hypothetical protein n=1 Tax=Pedobacter jeongneungensis TaxID=947309 RepID=UPI000468255A|nr:hypothetical protein [Pedobacter jeongneungensis]
MSLKGISKATVANMIGLLDQLEELEGIIGNDPKSCDQIRELKLDLIETYHKYERMVSEIAAQVDVYQDLYGKIRFRFVPEKLKSLRRIIPHDSYEFVLLKKSIHKSHLI